MLGWESTSTWGPNARAAYISLVAAEARAAGGKGSPTISFLSLTNSPSDGLLVRTRVALPPGPGQVAAAQALVARLTVPPGPDAAWLDQVWPLSSVRSVAR